MRAGILLTILLAPLAGAHGSPAPYDPLAVEIHAFLQADGTLAEAAPEPASRAFPASTPAAPGAALRFETTAPVRFAPVGGFVVELRLRADAPVATGDGLELAIEPGGEPQRVALPPVMAPGDLASVGLTLRGAAQYAKGDSLALTIRALAPALADGALAILVGPDASRMDALDLRIPEVADLELQDTDLVEFLAADTEFVPTRPSTIHRFVVGHDAVKAPTRSGTDPNSTYVVLVGEEDDDAAQAHAWSDRDRRLAAAHEFDVNGILARVHPGIGVVVPVTQFPIRVRCIANCPAGGYTATIESPVATPTSERPSALVPPPRETRDIPVSEDEPPTKATPMGPLAAAALLLALAARRRR